MENLEGSVRKRFGYTFNEDLEEPEEVLDDQEQLKVVSDIQKSHKDNVRLWKILLAIVSVIFLLSYISKSNSLTSAWLGILSLVVLLPIFVDMVDIILEMNDNAAGRRQFDQFVQQIITTHKITVSNFKLDMMEVLSISCAALQLLLVFIQLLFASTANFHELCLRSVPAICLTLHYVIKVANESGLQDIQDLLSLRYSYAGA